MHVGPTSRNPGPKTCVSTMPGHAPGDVLPFVPPSPDVGGRLGGNWVIRTMGIALAGLVLAGTAAVGFAQDSDPQAKLRADYDKKVAQAWFTDNGFTDDYDVALERAKGAEKPIFAYFTRSYSP